MTGPAAQVFEAWRQTGSDKARSAETAAIVFRDSVSLRSPTKEEFTAMLDDRGISFARASKEEAARSHKQAELARAADNYAPRFREGEIVIVTEARLERNAEPRRRVYKLDQAIAEKFVTRLEIADRLQNIESTLKASDQRQQLRRDERTAERMERATGNHDRAWITKGAPAASFMAQTAKAQAAIMEAAPRAVNAAFNIGVELSGLFFSLFDTPKSPRQQARDNLEGERLTDRRNARRKSKSTFRNTPANAHSSSVTSRSSRPRGTGNGGTSENARRPEADPHPPTGQRRQGHRWKRKSPRPAGKRRRDPRAARP